ncbi:Hypothetical_protein [Hexamita inflata]|uniref:Hypothetical_protein n=1 Tax=Hexamita inflata TaxID=28002 RepID=A0AA86RLV8_9EUKA|nr:Hypothetical protein HINF_LOCUS56485 [Hexamita inflata]
MYYLSRCNLLVQLVMGQDPTLFHITHRLQLLSTQIKNYFLITLFEMMTFIDFLVGIIQPIELRVAADTLVPRFIPAIPKIVTKITSEVNNVSSSAELTQVV